MGKREFLKIICIVCLLISSSYAKNLKENGVFSKLPVNNVIVKSDPYFLKDGYIVDTSGNKIFDEDGDVKDVFDVDGKWFYLMKIPTNKIYKIKSLKDKKTIRTFNANYIKIFKNNGKAYIGVMLGNYDNTVFDNIYKFNGKKFSLINKNVSCDGFTNQSVFCMTLDTAIDVRNGKKYTIKSLENEFKGIRIYGFIGSLDDKIIVVFTKGFFDMNERLGGYDSKNNRFYLLYEDKKGILGGGLFYDHNLVQFLKSGRKIVLKNKKTNQFIYLNKFEIVKGTDSHFGPIKIVDQSKQTIEDSYAVVNIWSLVKDKLGRIMF